MTQTIRVDQLLRETVQGPYCDLVTRSTGRAVRTSIQQRLAAGPGSLALIDFSQVGLVDFSCADEVIAKLLLDPLNQTTIVLQGLREEQLEAIEHVLEHHDLAALVQDGGNPRVVGRASPDLRTAFFTLQRTGPATVEIFAQRIGWAVERAETVLFALLRLRLIRNGADGFAAPLAPERVSP